QALHAAVDHGDARRVVAAVLEAPQALEQDRHDVTGGYGCDDSAHGAFLRMSSTPATAMAAEASATRSRSSVRCGGGRNSRCSSSSRLKASTEASTAYGARPAVPRQRSAVISAKQMKRASLSQCGGRRSAPMKTSASMMPTPVVRQTKRSVGILLLQHHDDGLQDDLQVEHQRPVAQVREVVFDPRLHLLHRLGLAAEAVHLRVTGDARAHLVADHVAADQLPIELVVRHGVGPRADNAHAPLQYIDELRQLVERGPAQEPAEGRDARIVLGGLAHDVAVLGHRHGAELVDHDLAAIDTVAALLEEDRAG